MNNIINNKILLSLLLSSINIYAFDLFLDVGHSPSKYGAMSSTCEPEYIYNKNLALYLEQAINQKKEDRILISSNIDKTPINFEDRYDSSNNKDLFLSIHHDSVQKQYLLLGKKCPTSYHAEGFSIFVSRKNKYFAKSYLYAKIIAEYLVSHGRKPSLHHSEQIDGENRELIDPKLGIYIFDDLKVLKNANSPAILFEAGVIVNPNDEKIIKSDSFKMLILHAIKDIKQRK